jgi:hypothetical protein
VGVVDEHHAEAGAPICPTLDFEQRVAGKCADSSLQSLALKFHSVMNTDRGLRSTLSIRFGRNELRLADDKIEVLRP